MGVAKYLHVYIPSFSIIGLAWATCRCVCHITSWDGMGVWRIVVAKVQYWL